MTDQVEKESIDSEEAACLTFEQARPDRAQILRDLRIHAGFYLLVVVILTLLVRFKS